MKKIEPDYFLINRLLLKSDRWLAEKFTRAQAWVDLIGLAQHTDSFFYVRGIKVEVKRGQLAYSQLTLKERWKWSRDKVRRFLACLESDGDIRQQNNNLTTIISIVKYDLWQGEEVKTIQQNIQQKNTKQDTYKKDKKDKEDIVVETTEELPTIPKIDYKKYESLYLSLLAEYKLPPAMISYGKFRANLPKVLTYLESQNETIENYWRWYLDEFHFKEDGKDVFATDKYGTEPSTTLSSYFVSKFIKEK